MFFVQCVSLGLVIPYQDVQCLCTQERYQLLVPASATRRAGVQKELQLCEWDGAATQVSEQGRGRKVGQQQQACSEKQEAKLRKGRLLETWCAKE